jgi:hypothetical protein
LRRYIRSFDDDAQEAAFWKSKAQALRELLDEAHVSLRDFEMSSKELEEEMDKELAQSNKQLEEAIRNNEKLSQDREEWKVSVRSGSVCHDIGAWDGHSHRPMALPRRANISPL